MYRNQYKYSLGFFPTPVSELKRLSSYLKGPKIYIKRDDQSGLALGGNKVRKLEYLLGAALSQGADTLVTGGAAQSNHCRQTAAAAAVAGLECHLALGGEEPEQFGGNLLLDLFFKAEIHWCKELRKGEMIPDICRTLKDQGKNPFIIPYGGSNAIGAIGFAEAVTELQQQCVSGGLDFSHLVFASSSGGTHAGLIVGKDVEEMSFKVIGIGIDKEEMSGSSLNEYIIELANEASSLLNTGTEFGKEAVSLVMEYTGDGYGVIGPLEREAIELIASLEGILLDPVYTGRAMGGMIDLIRNNYFSPEDRILFWHTGGSPALFAYGGELFGQRGK